MDQIQIEVPPKFSGLIEQHRYYVYYGGRGSAKSWSIAQYLICLAMSKKTKILCTRELQNSITESVHSLLSDIISRYELGPWFSIKNATIECVNGSVFIFKGLAHNIDSIKSTEGVHVCWVEEADKVSQNSWDILKPTIRKDNSRIIISFNPTHDDDPVYDMFVKNTQPDSLVVKVNWFDNPHFPEVLRIEMEHMKKTNFDKYEHVWLGELRTISDAQIFKGKWVVMDFDPWRDETLYFGMDFGFSADPTTVIRMFIRGTDLYIDREQVGYHVDFKGMPPMIRATMAGTESYHWQIQADCSRPETISYLKNAPYDFNIVGCKKWHGSVEDGIEYLRSFTRIIIHPDCPFTAEEFRRYSYKVDKKTNKILPIPIDDYNHTIDAIRYGLGDLIKHKATIYDEGVI